MASRMIGRANCPECGFSGAHVKESEKCLYRWCPECGSQHYAKTQRQRADLMDKTRLLEGSPTGSASAPAAAPAGGSPTGSGTESGTATDTTSAAGGTGSGSPAPAPAAQPAKKSALFGWA